MSANQKKRGENMLSVIIPAYNEEKMIQTTADTVDRILSEASVPYETDCIFPEILERNLLFLPDLQMQKGTAVQ